MSLHPRIAEVVAELESAQQAMHEQLAGIPESAVHVAPPAGGWTIAQVVEHLMLLEDGSGRLIGGMLKQLVGTVDEETTPIAPTLAKYAVWEPRARILAPEIVQPTGLPYADALAKQSASRQRLVDALRGGSGRALGTMTFPHPALGPLDGYQWALLTAQHQRRHLVQIANIAAAVC